MLHVLFPNHRLRMLGLAVCCLAACAGGCGRGAKTVRVWGTVTHDGQPVEYGMIVFFPTENTAGPSTGAAITSGEYDIPARSGPRAGGIYRVEITAYGPERSYAPAPGFVAIPVRNQLLPPKFNRETTLRATISAQADDNRRDFDLR